MKAGKVAFESTGALHTAADGCSPGRNRGDDTERCGGGVNDVSQLFSGNFVAVRQRAHHGTNGKAVEIVIDEDYEAEPAGSHNGRFTAFDLLSCNFTVDAGAA